jgi:hypothetical protein
MDIELKQGGKKTYEPPRLALINLRPEEAVLGHCKTLSGGSVNSVCNAFGIAPCDFSVGS